DLFSIHNRTLDRISDATMRGGGKSRKRCTKERGSIKVPKLQNPPTKHNVSTVREKYIMEKIGMLDSKYKYTNTVGNVLAKQVRIPVYDRSPRRRRASWISLGWMVTRLAWI